MGGKSRLDVFTAVRSYREKARLEDPSVITHGTGEPRPRWVEERQI